MKRALATLGAVAAALLALGAAHAGASVYADPQLLNVPWGNYSFVRQAWRGYSETVPARDYLDGLGVVWGAPVPGVSEDRVAAELAAAGFKRVRLEIPWGAVRWDETGFDDASGVPTARVLRALRAHGLRPLILLNANHLQPCPVQWRDVVVREAAAAGARSLAVTGDLRGVAARNTTVMSLADSGTAGPLIDGVAGDRRAVLALSKPLPRAVRAGEALRLAVLRYSPLDAVGTPDFERTAAGWLRYVELAAGLVATNYGDDFDVEIWNELTFGSAFLDVGNYVEPHAAAPDALKRGGTAWELARRTVDALAVSHPHAKPIWGFSNTTFFHVPARDLPPRLAGQSYHPYGTGRRCFADMIKGRERELLDGYVPPGCAVQPEGYAHAWQQTESLMRLLAPDVRDERPPGSAEFRHFITEHGFAPGEVGITSRAQAERAKQKFLLRAPLFWLGKGVSALYVYNAFNPDDAGSGVLGGDGRPSPAMAALQRLVTRLDGAEALAQPRPLTVMLERLAGNAGVLPGDDAGRYLRQQDAVAVLPLQIDESRFAVGVYVMTQNFPTDLPPQPYRLELEGLRAADATVAYYSPDSGASEPVAVVARTGDKLTLELGITDVPRLIEIDDRPRRAEPR